MTDADPITVLTGIRDEFFTKLWRDHFGCTRSKTCSCGACVRAAKMSAALDAIKRAIPPPLFELKKKAEFKPSVDAIAPEAYMPNRDSK